MVVQDGAFDKSKEMFEGILLRMEREAARGRRLPEVEERLQRELQELGRSMLQNYVDAEGPGDLGPTFEHQGRTLRRLEELHARSFVTVFGELHLNDEWDDFNRHRIGEEQKCLYPYRAAVQSDWGKAA